MIGVLASSQKSLAGRQPLLASPPVVPPAEDVFTPWRPGTVVATGVGTAAGVGSGLLLTTLLRGAQIAGPGGAIAGFLAGSAVAVAAGLIGASAVPAEG